MRAILRHQSLMMQPVAAEKLAADLNNDPEDNWTYTVRHTKGLSFVECRDERGNYIGDL